MYSLSHSMIHYLFTIHLLKESKGYARITDIAKHLEVTKGSVSNAIVNLKKKKLVVEEDAKFLNLTPEAHQYVHQVLSTRTLMYYFLKDFVEVSEEAAKNDSCSIEHLFCEETEEKLFSFMKKISDVCKNKRILDLKTSLDLSQYKSRKDFIDKQSGDSHLHE